MEEEMWESILWLANGRSELFCFFWFVLTFMMDYSGKADLLEVTLKSR